MSAATTTAPSAAAEQLTQQASWWQRANKPTLAMAGVTAAVCLFFALATENFLTFQNISNLATQVAPILVVGVAMTFVITAAQIDLADPADRVTLDETVSYALLVVLETLTPAERVTWVLHELFGVPFPEVADLVGRTPAAVRQLASRARARVREGAPRFAVDPVEHHEVFSRFVAAAAGGDLAALVATLDPDVVATSDGGGQVGAATDGHLAADVDGNAADRVDQ